MITPADLKITADAVVEEVIARYGDDFTPQHVADTYESMQAMAQRRKTGVWYTPAPVIDFMTKFSFQIAFRQIGPTAADVLRIIAIDPCCGTGPYLVQGAKFLAAQYAGRLIGRDPTEELVYAVMPTVILTCMYGVDIDPVAAELARICLSRETDGVLTPQQLEQHVAAGDTLKDEMPPALANRLRRSGQVPDLPKLDGGA